MTTLYVLDVPENLAACRGRRRGRRTSTVGRIGPYFVISAPGPIVDRPAGHRLPARRLVLAAWPGLADSRIVQHDKDALRVEPA